MKRSCNPVNARQKREHDELRELGCWICHRTTEIDHLVDKGTSKLSGGQDAVIPLCAWHHRGVVDPGSSVELMTNSWGPSFALHPAWAKQVYGTKRDIWREVHVYLGREPVEPVSKVFKRA